MLQAYAHLSAEILNFCRNCRNLRFLQKVCTFLQISAEGLQASNLEACSIQLLNCMLQDSRLEAYSIQLKAAVKTAQVYTSLRCEAGRCK